MRANQPKMLPDLENYFAAVVPNEELYIGLVQNKKGHWTVPPTAYNNLAALRRTEIMAREKTYNDNDRIYSPGDGEYRVYRPGGNSIHSISIERLDETVPLSGQIVFSMGEFSETIDLSVDRWLGLAGPVGYLNMTITGTTPELAYDIILS